jgi:hypothetical protein
MHRTVSYHSVGERAAVAFSMASNLVRYLTPGYAGGPQIARRDQKWQLRELIPEAMPRCSIAPQAWLECRPLGLRHQIG